MDVQLLYHNKCNDCHNPFAAGGDVQRRRHLAWQNVEWRVTRLQTAALRCSLICTVTGCLKVCQQNPGGLSEAMADAMCHAGLLGLLWRWQSHGHMSNETPTKNSKVPSRFFSLPKIQLSYLIYFSNSAVLRVCHNKKQTCVREAPLTATSSAPVVLVSGLRPKIVAAHHRDVASMWI